MGTRGAGDAFKRELNTSKDTHGRYRMTKKAYEFL